jgi:hypothetical protein
MRCTGFATFEKRDDLGTLLDSDAADSLDMLGCSDQDCDGEFLILTVTLFRPRYQR